MVAMLSPFCFGRMAEGVCFTDRKKETEHLLGNFTNNINTVLLSPRRWGKSSLVRKAGSKLQDPYIFIDLDAFQLKNEEDFYNRFAAAVIKATSSKWEEWVEQARRFLGRFSPKITIGTDPMSEFEISFNLEHIDKSYAEILDLPEQYARAHQKRIVICIDEFQSVAGFRDPLLFQKRLRSVWQRQQQVCYCVYGSKQHMMTELFERQSMPFYKFGEVLYLQKIAEADWIPFICERFASTGKKISPEQATRIARSVSCHPYYVQQLCHQVWIMTQGEVVDSIIRDALIDLLEQNAILYQRDTELLSGYQLNFLKAIASGCTSGFGTKENLLKYDLGSSANVNRLKKALENKELIDLSGKKATFLDPAYELWFKKEILKQKIEV